MENNIENTRVEAKVYTNKLQFVLFTRFLVTTRYGNISQTEVFYGKSIYYIKWNTAVK